MAHSSYLQRHPRTRRRPWLSLIVAATAVLVVTIGATHAAPIAGANAPLGVAAGAADTLRRTVGPAPVAWLEGTGSAGLDLWAQLTYRVGVRPAAPWGGSSVPEVSPPSQAAAPTNTLPVLVPTQTPAAPSAVPGALAVTAPPTVAPTPAPTPLPTAVPLPTLSTSPARTVSARAPLPGEGIWTASGLPSSGAGAPLLLKTFIRPDAARPYAQAVLLKMDLHRTRLHLVAGTLQPGGAAHPGRGVISPADAVASRLLAAFNGGFKAVNGQFGMVIGNTTYLPLRKDLATLALYADGSAKLGAWGVDLPPSSPKLVAARQNGPLLLQNGALTAQALDDFAWGHTITTSAYTWRSGMGLTRHGNLVWAGGSSLSARTLGEALRRAGAVTAMQLDINPFWVRAVTYAPGADGTAVPTSLWSQFNMQAGQFLTPYSRDFMYLTVAAPSAAPH